MYAYCMHINKLINAMHSANYHIICIPTYRPPDPINMRCIYGMHILLILYI